MCAQIWAATFCCVLGCLPVVGADRSGFAEGNLVVFANANAPSTFAYLRREADTLLQSAGYSIEWRGPQDSRSSDTACFVVLELDGDCSAPSTPAVPTASTAPRS